MHIFKNIPHHHMSWWSQGWSTLVVAYIGTESADKRKKLATVPVQKVNPPVQKGRTRDRHGIETETSARSPDRRTKFEDRGYVVGLMDRGSRLSCWDRQI